MTHVKFIFINKNGMTIPIRTNPMKNKYPPPFLEDSIFLFYAKKSWEDTIIVPFQQVGLHRLHFI